MKVVKHQLGFFLYGFIFWLPIAIVVLVGVYIFGDLEHDAEGSSVVLAEFSRDNGSSNKQSSNTKETKQNLK